ncbi:MAG: dUTP diphosphatase [Bacteroidota bacterium]|jgi:dUTP pyrophosphatase
MQVKVINNSKYPLPEYATLQSAGMDLRANISESVSLKSLCRELIPTGIYIELPKGYEAQIRPRSGLAFKNGVTVLNSPGTIDADYRGEIKVLLTNLSPNEFIIEPGERIAQIVFSKHETISWQEVNELNDSVRGSGGFGHTGIK